MARAFYRDYPHDGPHLSRRVRRLHIIREDGKRPGRSGYCGIQVGDVRRSTAGIFDPMPVIAPPGLSWCGKCVGEHAERIGQLDTIAAVLAVGGYKSAGEWS
jgi:hypothetical protein